MAISGLSLIINSQASFPLAALPMTLCFFSVKKSFYPFKTKGWSSAIIMDGLIKDKGIKKFNYS